MKKRRHPDWLKVKIPSGENYKYIKDLLKQYELNTVCVEARCPNIAECSDNGTATFLIMGKKCSRNCKYCHVTAQKPEPLDRLEPGNIAKVVKALKLKHVVITSVTRDDLPDNGSFHISNCVTQIKNKNPKTKVELLIPDLNGNKMDLARILKSSPDILGHNLETVKDLFPNVRPEGNYERSLILLKQSKNINSNIPTKSGLMIGLGETTNQIIEALEDLKNNDVNFITIGQYLQPSAEYLPVVKYYSPDEFNSLKVAAQKLGFDYVESGPLVRSSYHAEKAIADEKG